MRAVAERAGVNERTVYRHFTNERGLRDAVMHRLEQRAGIDLDELQLDEIGDVARRIFAAVASHPLERQPPLDPTPHRREPAGAGGVAAGVGAARRWGGRDADRAVAAAMLNVMWRVAVYEHLAVDWELDEDEAVAGITWVIGLIEDAVRAGRACRPRVRPALACLLRTEIVPV